MGSNSPAGPRTGSRGLAAAAIGLIALFGVALPLAAAAQPAGVRAPVDYGSVAAWLCRPGKQAACATGLDAMAVSADGARTLERFTAAPNPPIDCFYVYPTVSHQTTPYSDMTAEPQETKVALEQVGRLTSRCRLFAPLYRQMTLAGLRQSMTSGAKLDLDGPYADVLAAWRWYMGHDNHGRGVVLIGHSQGAILLQRLIAEEIDGKPAQRALVSAFLAGDPSLPVPAGRRVGGALKHIPLCAAAAETGCVYVWASYLADDADTGRHFGRNPASGMRAACVNPAAPGGGSAALKGYLPKPKIAPEDDPPWVALKGQLAGQCVADKEGDVLRVTILPGRYADLLAAGLHSYRLAPGWGLHRLDLLLTQGNILDLLQVESASWTRR